MNIDNDELLRKQIIALGEKGLHRAMLATYAPQILAMFAAQRQALRDEVMNAFDNEIACLTIQGGTIADGQYYERKNIDAAISTIFEEKK